MSAPALVLISEDHLDEMRAGFARYVAEYDVRVARSCHEALETGAEPPSTLGSGIPPELRPRLERGLAGLRLLGQLRRRRQADTTSGWLASDDADTEPTYTALGVESPIW